MNIGSQLSTYGEADARVFEVLTIAAIVESESWWLEIVIVLIPFNFSNLYITAR